MVHHLGEAAQILPLRRGADITFVGVGVLMTEQDMRGAGGGAHHLPTVFAGGVGILFDQPRVAFPGGFRTVGIAARQRLPDQLFHEGGAVRRVGPLGFVRKPVAPGFRQAFLEFRAVGGEAHHRQPQLLQPGGGVAVDILKTVEARAVPARQVGQLVRTVRVHVSRPPRHSR